MASRTIRAALFAVFASAVFSPLQAQEGMWPFNMVPTKKIATESGFTPSAQWLTHAQRASVRLPNCSASFVSANGLVLTNGHCAEEAVKALSTPRDLYTNGFAAQMLEDELRTDLTLMNLVSMDDVTQSIRTALAGNPNFAAAKKMFEEGASKASGHKCELVTLYQGARYDMYCYKVYDDVRLVVSSEKNGWFFGGDADNFEFPRYALDFALLRAYENGAPAKVSHYFTWSASGPADSSLVFMSGHPGSTQRLYTSDALKTQRDAYVPAVLGFFEQWEATIEQYSLEGPRQRSAVESELFGIQNTRKLFVGKLRGLQDPRLIKTKEDYEKRVAIDAALRGPSLAARIAKGQGLIRDAQPGVRNNFERLIMIGNFGFGSSMFDHVQQLTAVRAAWEDFQQGTAAEPPLNLGKEYFMLESYMRTFMNKFGAVSSEVTKLTGGRGPEAFAHFVVYEATAQDYQAIAGALTAMRASAVGEYQKSQAMEREGYSLLANGLFDLYGSEQYPDATFTLRLAFGYVRGYTLDGQAVAPWTTFGQAFAHAKDYGNRDAFELPKSWYAARDAGTLNLATPLDFVATLDITGGNSGSPVFNKELQIVGVAFDSNIHGLVTDYDYNYDPRTRAVMVHSSAILEALKRIYTVDRIVKEILGK
jgi:hypothetical protein